MKNIIVLGSTGTVGKNVLEVVKERASEWKVLGIACRNNKDMFAEQIQEFKPEFAYIQDIDNGYENRFKSTKFFYGEDGLEELVSVDNIDLVVYAIPGISTLNAFIYSIKKGQKVGLATKEIMVTAGPIVNELIKKHNGEILPIDSEHNAIFQALMGEDENNVSNIYLTASGGPFRGKNIDNPTVEQVLSHPVWNMGKKITVDSATMFNKAFELIEAHYLFSISPEKLNVLIHPEALIHGMVELLDGTIKGIFSMPDMKYPITFIMDYPNRQTSKWEKIDFNRFSSLTLEPANRNAKWFSLAIEAIEKKGSFPVVFNSANEEAVEGFLKGKIQFKDIISITEQVLSTHSYKENVTIKEIFEIDIWAKNKVNKLMEK